MEVYVMEGKADSYCGDEYENPGIPDELEERMKPDVIACWYVSGSYEGEGTMIFKNKDGWWHIGLSHCSCYGPGEYWERDLQKAKPCKSLSELEKEIGEHELCQLLRIHGWGENVSII